MANLTSLPNELLDQIFDHFLTPERSQQTLVSLCRVSRRFLPIAQDRLYASPGYDQDEVHIRSLEVSTTLLARTLIENDRLRLQVRHLTFYFRRSVNYFKLCPSADADISRMVLKHTYIWGLIERRSISSVGLVILLAQNLQTLQLRGMNTMESLDSGHREHSWHNIFQIPYEKLEDLVARLSLHTLKLEAFSLSAPWLMLPNLRHLELSGAYGSPHVPYDSIGNITSLTLHYGHELFFPHRNLDVGYRYRARRNDILRFLKKCSKLQELCLYFAGDLCFARHYGSAARKGNFDLLCEKILSSAETLESLDLASSKEYEAYKDSLDEVIPIKSLVRFSKLKALRVFSDMIFNHDTETGISVMTELPKSIETLQIRRPTAPALKAICDSIKQDGALGHLDNLTLHDASSADKYAIYSSRVTNQVKGGVPLSDFWDDGQYDGSLFKGDEQGTAEIVEIEETASADGQT
jgi:hypothetical protein